MAITSTAKTSAAGSSLMDAATAIAYVAIGATKPSHRVSLDSTSTSPDNQLIVVSGLNTNDHYNIWPQHALNLLSSQLSSTFLSSSTPQSLIDQLTSLSLTAKSHSATNDHNDVQSTTVISDASDFIHILPSLYYPASSLSSSSIVLHATATALSKATSALSLVSHLPNWSILLAAAGDAQEAHDLATLVHSLSKKTPGSLLLLRAREFTSDPFQSVAALSDSELFKPLSISLPEDEQSSQSSHFVVESIQAALDALNDAIHIQHNDQTRPSHSNETDSTLAKSSERTRSYSFFEYSGPQSPSHLVVIPGTAPRSFEKYHSIASPSVGILRVRVLRPWCPLKLFASIPVSTSVITVLDFSEKAERDGSSTSPLGFSQLFLDIAGALHSLPEQLAVFKTAPVLKELSIRVPLGAVVGDAVVENIFKQIASFSGDESVKEATRFEMNLDAIHEKV